MPKHVATLETVTDSSTRPHLLTLDEAVEFLRGAYAKRTLQNLAWKGALRYVGRGQRMCFCVDWLLDDLLGARTIANKERAYVHRKDDEPWSSGEENPGAATIGGSARGAKPRVDRKNNVRRASRNPRRESRLSGTSTANANANSRTAGARKPRAPFFSGRKRTTGDSKTSA